MIFLSRFAIETFMAPRVGCSKRRLLIVGEAVLTSLEMEGSPEPWGHHGNIGDSWLSSPTARLTWGLLEQVLQRPGMMGVLTSWRSRDIERLFFPPTIGRILVVGVLVTNIFPLVAEIHQYILVSLTKLWIWIREDTFRHKWLTRVPDRKTVFSWYRDILRQLQQTLTANSVVVIF